MTQKTFNVLEFCSTWLCSSDYGILQDQFISHCVDGVSVDDDKAYYGMWMYYVASVNRIALNFGYVADDVIQIGLRKFVYLYRLE